MSSKSWSASGVPASRAHASRCSTAFVEPPVAMTAAIALSKFSRLSTREGRKSSLSISTARFPAAFMTSRRRCLSIAGTRELPAGHELDGIGHDLARDERRLHALGAHGDAVGDRDRVHLDRRAAGLADPLLHPLGLLAVVEVAGHDLDPRVRDADERLLEVVVAVADRAHHRAG